MEVEGSGGIFLNKYSGKTRTLQGDEETQPTLSAAWAFFKNEDNTEEACVAHVRGLGTAQVNAVGRTGSLLHAAAGSNRGTVVRYLLSREDFNQTHAREPSSGRTAMHAAIALRDPYYNVRLHWETDVPAHEALRALLADPRCDALVNVVDGAGLAPVECALVIYGRARAELATSSDPGSDAAIEIACDVDSTLRDLSRHPALQNVEPLAKFFTLSTGEWGMAAAGCDIELTWIVKHWCCSDSFEHLSPLLHLSSTPLFLSPCHFVSGALKKFSCRGEENFVGPSRLLINDVLQRHYGSVLALLSAQLLNFDVVGSVKEFLGFDLAAEAALRNRRELVNLLRAESKSKSSVEDTVAPAPPAGEASQQEQSRDASNVSAARIDELAKSIDAFEATYRGSAALRFGSSVDDIRHSLQSQAKRQEVVDEGRVLLRRRYVSDEALTEDEQKRLAELQEKSQVRGGLLREKNVGHVQHVVWSYCRARSRTSHPVRSCCHIRLYHSHPRHTSMQDYVCCM